MNDGMADRWMMDGWIMNKWMDGWMDGWIDGWMDSTFMMIFGFDPLRVAQL